MRGGVFPPKVAKFLVEGAFEDVGKEMGDGGKKIPPIEGAKEGVLFAQSGGDVPVDFSWRIGGELEVGREVGGGIESWVVPFLGVSFFLSKLLQEEAALGSSPFLDVGIL